MKPIYKLEVYKNAREDPTESALVVPLDASLHADPFRAATAKGLAGYQPYLDPPRGRRCSLDPLSKKTDTGEMTYTILDKRLGAGNYERWVTAFLGDATGRERLKGCKVVSWFSTDGGTTWEPHFVGRIQSIRTRGRLMFEITARDLGEDLSSMEAFVAAPSGVSYVVTPNLLPSDGLVPRFEGLKPVQPLQGKILTGTYDGKFTPKAGEGFLDMRMNRGERRIVCRVLREILDDRLSSNAARIVVCSPDGETVLGKLALHDPEFTALAPIGITWNNLLVDTKQAENGPQYVQVLGVKPLAPTDPDYIALPTGTFYWYLIAPARKPESSYPLLLDNVNPIQVWKDLLDGKFGYQDENGTPLRKAPYDATAFGDLLADTSLPPMRFRLDEPERVNDWVEENICKPLHLGYVFDTQGRVKPLDLRLTKVPAAADAIGPSDLLREAAPSWEMSQDTAITRVEFTYYRDRGDSGDDLGSGETNPDFFPGQILSDDLLYVSEDLREEAFTGASGAYEIDARGFRFFPDEVVSGVGTKRADWLQSLMDRLIDEVRGPFGTGAMYTVLPVRWSSAQSTCQPGEWRIIDGDSVPNPASSRRGGNRIALCTDRVEEQDAVYLTFLDAGPQSVAVAPTLGTLTLSGTQLTVPVTLNAAGDPVSLWYAATGTGVAVAPAEDSDLWTWATRVTASGNAVIPRVPWGKRLWVRGQSRSEADGAAPKLPSPFVVKGPINVGAMPIPSALSAAYISKTSVRITFTPGSQALATQVLVVKGSAAPATWLSKHVRQLLAPGSTQAFVAPLEGPTVQYVIGLRHIDPYGQAGPVATIAVTTNSAVSTAPRPAGIALAI